MQDYTELNDKYQNLTKKAYKFERINDELISKEGSEMRTLREDNYTLKINKVRQEKAIEILKMKIRTKQENLRVSIKNSEAKLGMNRKIIMKKFKVAPTLNNIFELQSV